MLAMKSRVRVDLEGHIIRLFIKAMRISASDTGHEGFKNSGIAIREQGSVFPLVSLLSHIPISQPLHSCKTAHDQNQGYSVYTPFTGFVNAHNE